MSADCVRQVTASGLASVVLTPGSGSGNPGPADEVEVDYTGWTTDGKMFDSSVTREQRISFGLNQANDRLFRAASRVGGPPQKA